MATSTTAATGKSKTPTGTAAGKSKSTTPAASGKSTGSGGGTATGKSKTTTTQTTTTPAAGGGGTGVAINPTNLPPDAPGSLAWTDYAIQYSQQTGVPAEIILSLIQAESGGNQYIVGDGGASVGLFQLHERGVGAGLTVEQRYDPATQFDLMAPRIKAAYEQGVALGLVGRDLAVYTGYYAEKPAAGGEANYAYAYDVVTSYLATGVATIGVAPTNLPSGGTPAAPWAGWYAKGGSRGAAPLAGYSTDLADYNGQGVVEGLYAGGAETFSGGSGGYTQNASGAWVPIASASPGSGSSGGSAASVVGSLASGFAALFSGAAFQQSRVDSGDTVELFGTPLGPLGVPTSSLWGGGFVVAGLIIAALAAFLIAKGFDNGSLRRSD